MRSPAYLLPASEHSWETSANDRFEVPRIAAKAFILEAAAMFCMEEKFGRTETAAAPGLRLSCWTCCAVEMLPPPYKKLKDLPDAYGNTEGPC